MKARLRVVVASAVLGAAVLTAGAPAHAAAPANDDFSAPLVLEGASGTTSGSTVDATAEGGEPEHAGVGHNSVWFSWAASEDGVATFDTFGSGFDTVLGVYTGTAVNSLTEVASNDDDGGVQSRVGFAATAGATYAVAVAGFTGSTGPYTLNWSFEPGAGGPDNDDFTDALRIEGQSGEITGTTVGATEEPGEPRHAGAGEASVWFRWTAPDDDDAVFDTFGSDFDTVLAVYTGDTVDALAEVASNDDAGGLQSRVRFAATGGTDYAIAVAGFSGRTGAFSLQWEMHAAPPNDAPPNDDLESASALDGDHGEVTGTNDGASLEPGEAPLERDATSTVWWTWDAPHDDVYRFSTLGSGFDTVLAVFTGDTVNALELVVENDNEDILVPTSDVVFPAAGGTTYHVAVAGASGASGDIALSWSPRRPAANDDFADATVLAGATGAYAGESVLATFEDDEPRPDLFSIPSVWFSWTAPETGLVVFDTDGTRGRTVIGAYTGDRVDALTEIARDDFFAEFSVTAKAIFRADAGTTYHLALGAAGRYQLTWTMVGELLNDDVAGALVLDGTDGSVAGSNVAATREPGEPLHPDFGYPSVWYAWTAPASGAARFTVEGPLDAILAAYAGTSVGDLDLLPVEVSGGAPAPRIRFDADAGETYLVAVAGVDGATGEFELGWAFDELDPPVNDDFADAHVLDGTGGTFTGTNVVATSEPNEPHDGGRRTRSVWFRFTAPADGVLRADTVGSEFDTVLAAHAGTVLADLRFLAASGLTHELHADVAIGVAPGETYHLGVFGFDGASGRLALSWAFEAIDPPPHDDFAAATALTGPSGAMPSTSVGATPEPVEPDHINAGTASVWFRWTAPADDAVRFVAARTDPSRRFHTALNVYTGSTLDALEPVTASAFGAAEPRGELTLRARRGVTYHMAVAGALGEMGPFELRWETVTPPDNDDFRRATGLIGPSGRVVLPNLHATVEPGEPQHAGQPGGASIWAAWRSPVTGPVTFDTFDGHFSMDTALAVYTGHSLDSLVEVASNDDAPGNTRRSMVQFVAQRGTTYWVAIDSFHGVARPFLNVVLSWGAGLGNDHFANAETLAGITGRVDTTNRHATREPGEPAGLGGGATIWYQWQPSSDGEVSFDTNGSVIDTTMSVYAGSALDDLELVAESDDAFIFRHAVTTFETVAGETYWLAVDGAAHDHGPEMGDIRVSWRASPPNDAFGDAEELEGLTGSVTGLMGTRERGEIDHAGTGRSTWHRWTAPDTATATFSTGGSEALNREVAGAGAVFDSVLAVYRDDGGVLRRVAWNADLRRGTGESTVRFAATAGTTYYVVVDAQRGSHPRFRLSWVMRVAPPNDDLVDAEHLDGRRGRTTGTNQDATLQPDEPASGSSRGSTVWYRWVAPDDGRLVIDVGDRDTEFMVDAYTGTSIGDLVRASYDDAPVGVAQLHLEVPVSEGVTYWISVDGAVADDIGAGPFELSWRFAPSSSPA